MLLFLLAYAGGVLTIVSPCILPVLPFVFARSDQPFVRSGFPLLIGMAATFALVATLAAVGGGWVVSANDYGRTIAIVLLAVFGVSLIFPQIADRLTRPLVALGGRLSQSSNGIETPARSQVVASFLLGVATGLLWAPCAGPVLGLILTGAALGGASVQTTLLLLAYALGAATSLALALLVGGRVFKLMKRSLGVGEWIRRGLGVAVLAAVVAIGFGLDTGLLTRLSLTSTAPLEQSLLDQFAPQTQPQQSSVIMYDSPAMMSANPAMMSANQGMMAANPAMMSANPSMIMQATPGKVAAEMALPIEGTLPSLDGAVTWLNSPPLSIAELKGKVVLIEFWTYSCINCLRALPYTEAWAEKYKAAGLVVIGVHAPEFAFEKSIDNVKSAVKDLHVTYPVAIDNNYAIWRAFNNQYWPAHYFIDAEGRIRHHHFGEGGYDESDKVIRQLLAEAGKTDIDAPVTKVSAGGVEAASDTGDVQSPETYVGYARAENFLSATDVAQDTPHSYAAGAPRLNEWGLTGNWTIGSEQAALNEPDGAIVYRFHARDLHLVLGPTSSDKPVKFRVTIDGKPPGASHGVDVDADGNGTVTEERLYQLIRQSGPIADHTFEIRFLDSGARAYAFTFG
jgi:cytochrome c biogenesis protein CcdA/thiol-disulfide isomerase/thioredoxin